MSSFFPIRLFSIPFFPIKLVLLYLFLFTLLSTSSLASHADTKTATTILLFGDSIIAGYGLAEKDSLSPQLESYMKEKQQNVKVVNAGVSGDTTSGGLTRLLWTLQRNAPDIVFLALGGNDVLRGIDPANTRQNLNAMLQILQANGVKVIFSQVEAPTNLGEDYRKELSDAYKELATLYNVPLYPFLLQDIFTTPELMLNDGIHPSAAGIKAISKPLGNYIIQYIMNQPITDPSTETGSF